MFDTTRIPTALEVAVEAVMTHHNAIVSAIDGLHALAEGMMRRM